MSLAFVCLVFQGTPLGFTCSFVLCLCTKRLVYVRGDGHIAIPVVCKFLFTCGDVISAKFQMVALLLLQETAPMLALFLAT